MINPASVGFRPSDLTSKIAQKNPQTLDHLFRIIDGYSKGEEDTKGRMKIQAEFDKAAAQADAVPLEANTPPPTRQGPTSMTWKKFRTNKEKPMMAVEEV